jgi:hypoxia up-regulated 1
LKCWFIAQLQLHEATWDLTLGGREFDYRLAKHIAELAKQKGAPTITPKENPKAFAKLMKEAQRVKEILSANQDALTAVRET